MPNQNHDQIDSPAPSTLVQVITIPGRAAGAQPPTTPSAPDDPILQVAALSCATGDTWRLAVDARTPTCALVQRAVLGYRAGDSPDLWQTIATVTPTIGDLSELGVRVLPAQHAQHHRIVVDQDRAMKRLYLEMRLRGAVPIDGRLAKPQVAAVQPAPQAPPDEDPSVRQPTPYRRAALELITQACEDRGYGGPVQFVRLEAAIDAVVRQAKQIADLRAQLQRALSVVDAVALYADAPAHEIPASVADAYRAYVRRGEQG